MTPSGMIAIRYTGDSRRSEAPITGKGKEWWPGELRCVPLARGSQLLAAGLGWERDEDEDDLVAVTAAQTSAGAVGVAGVTATGGMVGPDGSPVSGGDLSVALNTTTTLEHLPSTTAWAATLTPASYVSRFGFSSNVAIVVTVAGVTSPAANIQIQYSNDAGVSVASGPTTIGTISANGTQTINLNPLTMPGAMFKVLINSGTGTGGTAGINVTMS